MLLAVFQFWGWNLKTAGWFYPIKVMHNPWQLLVSELWIYKTRWRLKMACFTPCRKSSFNLSMVQIELSIGHKFRIFMKNSYGTENRRQWFLWWYIKVTLILLQQMTEANIIILTAMCHGPRVIVAKCSIIDLLFSDYFWEQACYVLHLAASLSMK